MAAMLASPKAVLMAGMMVLWWAVPTVAMSVLQMAAKSAMSTVVT
jgi:hypothetical protein